MIALGWAAGAAAPALASPSALSLMRRSDRRHEVAAERVEITMRLQEKGRAARTRRLSMLTAQRDATGDRLLLRFEAPASIAGTALLSVEDPRGGGGEQWLYLPAFRKTRRIGTAELGDRFMGTDLYYEDMQSEAKSRTLDSPTVLDEEIFQSARRILRLLFTRRLAVRNLGIELSRFEPAEGEQLSLLDGLGPQAGPARTRLLDLEEALDRVRDRFGFASVTGGASLNLVSRLERDRHGFVLRTPSLTK